ncbi:MAG: hypothetical protein LBJ43_01560 [Propionibacteriaceae bacterium]|jgi:ribose transport system permease protein|nr:hypothetical protein [Propionibacteriaceae bacterium]
MKRLAKNILLTLIVPVSVTAIMLTACQIKGVPFWAPGSGFRAFIYSMMLAVFSAFALSLHMFAGRFDFSLGSVAILSAVIGGKIALAAGTNMFGMLIIFLIVGAVLGTISGLLYLLLNLPPMITSLGVALAYEGLSFAFSEGRGIQIALHPELLGGAALTPMFLILAISLIIMYALMNFTRFGFNYRAIQYGQKIAVDTGLNEKSNALVCYAICGSLVAIVGFLRLSYNGALQPQLNLSTSGTIFSAMLPLFIAALMVKVCESNIALVIGCFTATIITQGLSSIGLSAQTRSLISAFLMMFLLMYSINGQKWRDYFVNRKAKAAVQVAVA